MFKEELLDSFISQMEEETIPDVEEEEEEEEEDEEDDEITDEI